MARFYVYALIDPRDGKTFYVGKGQGSRYRAHEREALKGKHSRKCELIKEILASGHAIEYSIIKRFESEVDAYAAEETLIGHIGLQNLTNEIPGGGIPRTQDENDRFLRKNAHFVLRLFACMQVANTRGLRWVVAGTDVTQAFGAYLNDLIARCGWDRFEKILAPIAEKYSFTVRVKSGCRG